MPTYYPQINSNLIITQLPYTSGQAFGTIVQDVETGMRWTFPLRGAGLDNHPTGPRGQFGINYTNITDAEVATLLTFFRSVRGRWGAFRLLDPGGNLLTNSENFADSSWDKTNGPVTVGSTTIPDPFGGTRATQLSAGSGDSFLLAPATPSDGGLMGYVMCASIWVQAQDVGVSVFIGFANSMLNLFGSTVPLPYLSWLRIHATFVLTDNNAFRFCLGGNSTWTSTRQLYVYGAQVSSMKGEGPYIRTPGNYAYHQNVRFDTDNFARQALGPNQNAVQLPCIEYYVVGA